MITIKMIVIAFIVFLLAIKIIFQVNIDIVNRTIIVFYYSLDKKRRMSFIIKI